MAIFTTDSLRPDSTTPKLAKETINVPEWVFGELLRHMVGDPAEFLVPRPAGRCYWGQATDEGVPIETEDEDAGENIPLAVMGWEQLIELVDQMRNLTVHRAHYAANKVGRIDMRGKLRSAS
jgi:hypothetical protein